MIKLSKLGVDSNEFKMGESKVDVRRASGVSSLQEAQMKYQ